VAQNFAKIFWAKKAFVLTQNLNIFSHTLYSGFSLIICYFEEGRKKSKDIGETATL